MYGSIIPKYITPIASTSVSPRPSPPPDADSSHASSYTVSSEIRGAGERDWANIRSNLHTLRDHCLSNESGHLFVHWRRTPAYRTAFRTAGAGCPKRAAGIATFVCISVKTML